MSSQTVVVRVGLEAVSMPYREALTHAYLVLRAGYPREAGILLSQLQAERPRDKWAKLLRIRADQQVTHLGQCLEILEVIASAISYDTAGPVAVEFRRAIALRDVGLMDPAAAEVRKVVAGYPDMATACLNFGDMLALEGHLQLSIDMLKIAVQRDRRGGPTARTARRQIKSLTKQIKNQRDKNRRKKR